LLVFDRGNKRFNYRAIGVIIHDDKVLTCRAEQDDFWALPGGRVEFGESSPETLVRELKEELGVDAHVERLLWVGECFFDFAGKSYHELGLYHLVELAEASPIYGRAEFRGVGEESYLIFRWCPLEDIEEVVIEPRFLKGALRGLGTGAGGGAGAFEGGGQGVGHFVERG